MAEKSLDIIVRARDEASGKLFGIEKGMRDFAKSGLGTFIAAGAVISTMAKATSAGFEMMAASAAAKEADLHGTVDDMLGAQLKMHDAWGSMAASIPLLGPEIKKVMDIWGDREGIEKAIQNLKELEGQIQRLARSAQAMETKAAVLAAENRGASELEIARLTIKGQAELRDKARADEREKTKTARDETLEDLKEAEAEIAKLRAKRESLTREFGVEAAPQIAPGLEEDLKEQEKLAAGYRATLTKGESEYQRERAASAELTSQQLIKAERNAAAEGARITEEKAKAEQDALAQRARAVDATAMFLADDQDRQILALQQHAERLRTMDGITAEQRADIARREQEQIEKIRQEGRDREAAEQKKHQDQLRRDQQTVEDKLFNATHSAKERRLRDLETELKAMREKHEGNAKMLAKIAKYEAAMRAQIEAGAAAAATGPKSLAAVESRFLRRAPGTDEPAWARTMNRLLREQEENTGLIEEHTEQMARRERIEVLIGTMPLN